VMERLLHQQVRHEYERAIQERDNELQKYKESFHTYKSDLNNQIKEEVAMRLTETSQDIKQLFRRKLLDSMSQKGDIEKAVSSSASKRAVSSDKQAGYYEEESMKEINALNRFIRLFKVFTKLKEVIATEKHERELALQRQTLSSNAGLWDQLAEAEKREAIVRQELYISQQNNQTYEKIISKLQHQLETIQSEKLRLL